MDTRKFHEIPAGDKFEYHENIYIKLHEYSGEYKHEKFGDAKALLTENWNLAAVREWDDLDWYYDDVDDKWKSVEEAVTQNEYPRTPMDVAVEDLLHLIRITAGPEWEYKDEHAAAERFLVSLVDYLEDLGIVDPNKVRHGKPLC